MIISHKYKYVFIQVPRTASSSIGKELCYNYAGEPILYKHACYDDFLKQANPEEKEYFVFAGMRNPLDCIVTEYFRRKEGKGIEQNALNLEKYLFIRDNNASFQEFLKKFHNHFHKPGKSFIKGVDFVYKYENLQQDFSRILDILGIEQKRPLPQFNRTTGKTDYFLSYFTIEVQPMVRIVLGKRMKKYGYEFTADWLHSSGKTPFLFMTALVKTALFAAKYMRLYHNRTAIPGSDDVYSRRLKKTCIEGRKSETDNRPSGRTE